MRHLYIILCAIMVFLIFATFSLKAQAQATDVKNPDTFVSLGNDLTSLIPKSSRSFDYAKKSAGKGLLPPVYIVKTPFGSYSATSLTFNDSGSCVFVSPMSVLVCGNFLITSI